MKKKKSMLLNLMIKDCNVLLAFQDDICACGAYVYRFIQ